LEDRHVILTNIFENLDNILPDWAKENADKSLVKAVNRYESRRKKEKHVSL